MQGAQQVVKTQAQGPSATATTAYNISRASTDRISMEISMRSTDTCYNLNKSKPYLSFRAPFGQPAGHGSVHTDENHAVIIPAKVGDNTYSLLQLPGVVGGEIRG